MLGSLRVIALLALLALAGLAAAGGWWVQGKASDRAYFFPQNNNYSIGQGYLNAVWFRHRADMMPVIYGNDPSQLRSNPKVAEFAQDTMRYFEKLPILRANIYTVKGALLMSVNATNDGVLPDSPPSPAPIYIQRHIGDTAISHHSTEYQGEGNPRHLMIQTMVPMVVEPGGRPEVVLELLTDITELDREFNWLSHATMYGGGGLLLVVLIGFVWGSRKAENIIATQHEANQELLAAVATAQAENQNKSQFLANVSHELRTPLNAIIGFSNIIKNEVMPHVADQKYHNYINDIHASGVHLLSLINDILDFSKAEAGKLELEIEEVNANRVIQNCLRLVSTRAEESQLKLLDNLPKEQFILVNDGKKFKQIMLNLLSNAVKFTPTGGQVSVTAWRNLTNDSISFEVQDTGIGIAPKDISRAMTPFGQIDNSLKRKYDGTGLGLPLTKKFVELMGGTFMIESQVGVGTKIIFTLPCQSPAEKPAQVDMTASPSA